MRPLLINQEHPNDDHHNHRPSPDTTDTVAGAGSDVTSHPRNNPQTSQKSQENNNSRHRSVQRPNSRLSYTPASASASASAATAATAATATDLRKRASVPSTSRSGGGAGRPKPLPPTESLVINYTRKPIVTLTPAATASPTSTRTATSPRPDDSRNNTNPDHHNPVSPNRLTPTLGAIAPQPTTSTLGSKTRPPLNPRTQNASQMKKRPLEIGLFKIGAGRGTASPSPRTNMPPERSNATSSNNHTGTGTGTGNANGNSNANRPPMPSLSASAARAANKTPLMPKLASKAQPPTLATTPIARRSQRPPTASANGQHTQQHDELLASSMPPFLANITPRSGSRQTRVDSANTTPNGTPHLERLEWSDQKIGSGPASPPPRPDHARRSASSISALQHEPNGHGGRDQLASESKFFHASDVHNARPQATPKQNPAKQSTFFYASNRNSVEIRPNNASAPSQSMPTATQSQHDISSKFMYANGTPELQSTSLSVPLAQPPRPAATSAPKPSTGRLSVGSQASVMQNQRPTSPTKGPSQPTQPSLMSSAIPPTMSTQRGPPHLPGSAADKLRRTSSGTSRTRGPHSRSGSLVLTDLGASTSVPSSKLMSPQYPSSPVHTPSTPTPLTLASIIQAAEDLPDQDESHSADDSRSEVQSPTKSSSTDPANELVANARRERKVQDLQITNASLEAINRTLERQLRKQTTELRRFKRMSRAGLSLASTAASSSIPSEAIFVEEVGLRLANLSEDESDAEAEDEAEEESFSDTDEDVESLTPNQLAERDAKHQERDQQRLKLDLTKHQQLLVDSQQINQSIKRCLDWTEELIKDGKKALAYNVKISDVELISKIPNALPNALGILEERGGSSHLGDDLADDTLKLGNLVTEEPEGISDWRVGPQDRDSGIEMPVDGG